MTDLNEKPIVDPVGVFEERDAVGVKTAVELAGAFSSQAGFTLDDLGRMDQMVELSMQGLEAPIVILR